MVIINGGRVIAWTNEAERATGISGRMAVGRRCHEVLALSDSSGTPICTADCPIAHGPLAVEGGERAEVTRAGRAESMAMWTATGSCGEGQLVVHTFSRRSASDAGESPLTRRQVEILGLVAQGMSTSQIASLLYLSPATVRNHVAHILGRLGARTRAQAVARAQQRGLIGAAATWRTDDPAA